MRITVLFFAGARELAGDSRLELALPDGATAGQARQALAAALPKLAPLLARCALAADERFVDDEEQLMAGLTLAVLPPVSGG